MSAQPVLDGAGAANDETQSGAIIPATTTTAAPQQQQAGVPRIDTAIAATAEISPVVANAPPSQWAKFVLDFNQQKQGSGSLSACTLMIGSAREQLDAINSSNNTTEYACFLQHMFPLLKNYLLTESRVTLEQQDETFKLRAAIVDLLNHCQINEMVRAYAVDWFRLGLLLVSQDNEDNGEEGSSGNSKSSSSCDCNFNSIHNKNFTYFCYLCCQQQYQHTPSATAATAATAVLVSLFSSFL